ncbi:MAG: aminotransferase class I/II-fold pyridoxal phosphate-dependent enzyme, partial [Chloroflexota bacterium]
TVRTASKAYALAGLRVGFAVARPEVIARLNPFRPPGSVSTISVSLVTEALLDPTVLDEAYAEFVGSSLVGLRETYRDLITVRTASKAYALAGLRVGFAVARPEVIARLNPFRPPGSVSTISVSLVTEALLDPTVLDANLARVAAERERLTDALRRLGWDVGPSVTNFILVGFGAVERAASVGEALLSRGLVPRTFGASHPLADHLRLTVRDPAENDRLIAAATEIEENRA